MTTPFRRTSTGHLSERVPEERRLATVMFADVQGFTALSEQHDFETISDLIKEVWLRLDAVIEQYGGYIDKHFGDGVMAVWGAPHAGEDDAENAVAAGLALHASLDQYSQESERAGAAKLKLRIGINTGMVLAGYVGIREEYTVMGDTVNVARRLEQLARPGAVLISESTYLLVRGVFRVRRLDELVLKGKTGKFPGYLVLGFVTQPSKIRYRSVGGLSTRMVARDAEIERLQRYYRHAQSYDYPSLVLITGEAGIGKSRLLMEFSSRLELEEPNLTLISARALAQTSRIPFFLWKALWHNRFGLSKELNPEEAASRFIAGVQKLWGADEDPAQSLEAAYLIGSLTGVPIPSNLARSRARETPSERVQRAFELTQQMLARATVAGPIVLLLDDLHWADNASLDLLTHLIQSRADKLPLLILAGSRPDLIQREPRWANAARVITLKPLPVKAEIVSAAYPDLESIPKTVLAELAWRSDGNPYFLEELVKSLVNSGLLEQDRSDRKIIEHLRNKPPESLRGMLQARLDALFLEAREVLLLASVVGRVFWVGAVLAAAKSSKKSGTGFLSGTAFLKPEVSYLEEIIRDALQQLVWAEMVFPRAGTKFSDEQEYIFKHSLLRDVAYSLLPIKYRRQHHLAVADWLSAQGDPDFRVMVATHLEKAEAFEDAAREYYLASREAASRGADHEADWLSNRASEIVGKIKQDARP